MTAEKRLSVGARTPAVAATPSQRQPAAARDLEADREAGLGLGRAVDARGGAHVQPARGWGRRDRWRRRRLNADGRRGRRRRCRNERRVQRERDEHGGGARPLVAVAPGSAYCARLPERGHREPIAEIGHLRNVLRRPIFVSLPTADPSATATASALGHCPVRRRSGSAPPRRPAQSRSSAHAARIFVRPHRAWAYRIRGLPARLQYCLLLAACVPLGATACGRHVYLGSSATAATAGRILWQAPSRPAISRSGPATATAASTWTPGPRRPAASREQLAPRLLQRHRHLRTDGPDVVELSVSRSTEPSRGVLRRLVLHSRVDADQSWLSLHHFGYHPTAGAADTMPVWDFHVYPTAGGTLAAHLYESSTIKNFEQANPVPVPMATWVHFEILLPQSGRRDRAHHRLAGRRADPRRRRTPSPRRPTGPVGRGRRLERHRAVAGDRLPRRRDDQPVARRHRPLLRRGPRPLLRARGDETPS